MVHFTINIGSQEFFLRTIACDMWTQVVTEIGKDTLAFIWLFCGLRPFFKNFSLQDTKMIGFSYEVTVLKCHRCHSILSSTSVKKGTGWWRLAPYRTWAPKLAEKRAQERLRWEPMSHSELGYLSWNQRLSSLGLWGCKRYMQSDSRFQVLWGRGSITAIHI